MQAITLHPTLDTARINSLDIVRGIALLGILLMNITSFGLSESYFNPTVNGGGSVWDIRVWWIAAMFFEGTMRGMFSMLFGAGILLFTNRSADTINGLSVGAGARSRTGSGHHSKKRLPPTWCPAAHKQRSVVKHVYRSNRMALILAMSSLGFWGFTTTKYT